MENILDLRKPEDEVIFDHDALPEQWLDKGGVYHCRQDTPLWKKRFGENKKFNSGDKVVVVKAEGEWLLSTQRVNLGDLLVVCCYGDEGSAGRHIWCMTEGDGVYMSLMLEHQLKLLDSIKTV